MAHDHSLYDTDMHFLINTIEKTIKNQSKKTIVVRGDHNSERFTFEIPRYVEGHDMSLCNLVQIHYLNVDFADVYRVKDLQVYPDDDSLVVFSWKLKRNATQKDGGLHFAIHFKCVAEDGTVEYEFRTIPFKEITVAETIDNAEAIVEEYPDILAEWEARLNALETNGGGSGGKGINHMMVTSQDIPLEGETSTVNIRVSYTDGTSDNLSLEVPHGPPGKDYVLTDEDKTEIAEQAADKVGMPVEYIKNVDYDSMSEEKTYSFGDINNSNATSVTNMGTFWVTNIDEMVAVRGCKIKSITLNCLNNDRVLTIRGSDVIIDKYSSISTAVNHTTQANETAIDLFKIITTSGISTYNLDGTDERVTILNQDLLNSCPNSIGLCKTGDTATFRYGMNVTNKGYFSFTYISGANNYTTSQELSFDLEVEKNTNQTNCLTFTMQDNTVKKFRFDTENLALKEKKLSIIGDSISTYAEYIPNGYATYYPRGDVDTVDKTWWKQLIDETGMRLLVNASWSGSYVTGDSTSTTNALAACSNKRITDLANGEITPDIIICYIGINDFGQNVHRTLGEYVGQSELPSEGTINTFSEAYALMIKKAMSAYPNAMIYCCSLLETKSANWDTDDNGIFPCINNNDVALAVFNERIKTLCLAMGAKFIDLHSCGINYWNLDSFTIDGLHPNAEGAKLIASHLAKELY